MELIDSYLKDSKNDYNPKTPENRQLVTHYCIARGIFSGDL